jgi:hypothetical protein
VIRYGPGAVRIPTLLIGLGLTIGLAACGAGDDPDAPAERAAAPAQSAPAPDESKLPLWKRRPDKPAGPEPAPVVGQRRSFELERVASGLQAPNQLVARTGDRRLFVTEQAGLVRTLPGKRRWLDLRRRTKADGERGLLSLAFSRDGRTAYVLLTTREAGDTRVLALPVRDGRAQASRARTVLALDQPYENHNGGTVLVDERDRVVVSLGDGGSAFDPQQRAQDPDQQLGKLLRWDPSEAGRPRWEVVATGLRNPFRVSFDRETGRLWVGDVGQDRLEEVSAIFLPEPGVPVPNLGWAAYEGHLPLGQKRLVGRPETLVWPVASYGHRDGLCSVTGGFVARGAGAPAALRGRYLYGDFCRGTMWSLDPAAAEDLRRADHRQEVARLPGLVSFGEARDGTLYAVSIQGDVHRLRELRSAR